MNNFRLEYNSDSKLNVNIGFAIQLIRYHYEHDEDKFKEFHSLFDTEVDKLKESLYSININDILRIMGFNV